MGLGLSFWDLATKKEKKKIATWEFSVGIYINDAAQLYCGGLSNSLEAHFYKSNTF